MSRETVGGAQQESPHPVAFVSEPARRILFLCIHNSARSQMAEAFARKMAPPGTEVWSAGSAPTSVHPLAIQVMEEAGFDLDGQRSKPISEVPLDTVDTIVMVCGDEDACPRVASTVRRVHWPLPDPAAAPESKRLQAFRETREELRWRVSCLWPRGD